MSHLEDLVSAAGPVSRETFLRLEKFTAEFERWNSRINLAAASTLPGLWERHVLDSAQLLPLAPDALRWVDLGSGGGFPGAVIAILLVERSGGSIDLVESNTKKAAFLAATLGGLAAPARVHAMRIDAAALKIPKTEIVTARALAPLADLLGLAEPWLTTGARGHFHKGRDYAREISESRSLWRFDLITHPSRTSSGSVILEISNLRRGGAETPDRSSRQA